MGLPSPPKNAGDDAMHQPLLGYIVCCTSIPPEERAHLAGCAEQMGAIHKFDLTSDVTHLIVGDTDTPKYKFVAKERLDVVCVLSSWIEAIRESWMAGGATNVLALEKAHSLPTLYKLDICVTGFVDDLVEERRDLERKITIHGGHYKPNLTREETHLIANDPEGAKYEFAEKWNIKTVAIDWLDQSIERGMILEESLFHPRIAREQRGVGAWIRKTISTTSLGKRTRETSSTVNRSRKLRRTASAKFERETSDIWDDIFIQEPKAEDVKESEWDDAAGSKPEAREEIVERHPVADARDEKIKHVSPTEKPILKARLPQSLREGDIFSGKHFVLHGFNEKKFAVLEEHISSRGGIVSNFDALAPTSDRATHLVVPHDMPPGQRLDPTEKDFSPELMATELWIQRCLYRRRYEEPSAHVTNRPVRQFPIEAFQELKVCSTAFQGVDLLVTATLAKLVGANYDQLFDSSTSVLVCNDVKASKEKLRHAAIWGVPAVRAEWLWDSILDGQRMPFRPYLLQPIKHPTTMAAENKSSKVSSQLSEPQKATKTSKPNPRAVGTSKRITSPDDDFSVRKKETTPFVIPDETIRNAFPDNSGPVVEMLDDGGFSETAAPYIDSSSQNRSTRASSSLPLREITPNSSVPKHPPNEDEITKSVSASTPKPLSQSPLRPLDTNPLDQEDDSLGPTISSLLAHHQRRHSNQNTAKSTTTAATAAATTTEESSHPPRRRRRQLLGRAPSNLSNHSLNLSRASSVDTAHTDGLGTPISSLTKVASGPSNVIFDNHAEQEEEARRQEEQLQMTQIGYEDLNVNMWRERVSRKMRGEKVGYGKGATPRKGTGGGKGPVEALGIGRRTRMAGGGR